MIDLHNHILHGLDDGAATLEESIEMAKAAVREGIEIIVATPHHLTTRFVNSPSVIVRKVDELNKILKNEGIPIKVVAGQEIRVQGDLLNCEDLLSLDESTGYLLVELPTGDVPHYTRTILYELQLRGFTPIIAHPERNRLLQEQPELLYSLVKHGALTQLTAGSLVGKFGRSAQRLAFDMIEHNLAHLVASDAHRLPSRGYYMKDAFEKIRKKFGYETMYRFMENAYVLLQGEMVYTDPPEKIKPKKRIGIFG